MCLCGSKKYSKNKMKTFFYSLLFIFSTTICFSATSCSEDSPADNDDSGKNPSDTIVRENSLTKVLFIGIDGCVPSAITETAMPNLYQLVQQSWAATNALAEVPTWSATGWSGLLTGVSVEKHNVTNNEFTNNRLAEYPSLFKYIKQEKPGWRTTSFVQWEPININIVKTEDVTKKIKGSDQTVENSAIEELQRTDPPELMFLHFDDVDHAGHDKGFGLATTEYANAVKVADARVGRILAAVKARPTYGTENWLIVVATDHGGNGTGHGGSSYVEQNAFIVLNNKHITPKLVNTPPTITPQPIRSENGFVVYENGVYGTLPALPELNFAADKSFTIEMDVKLDVVNGDDPSFFGNKDWNSGANSGITFVSRSMGQLLINIADVDRNRLDMRFSGVLADKAWHHVSLVVDRATQTAKVYVDGLLKTTDADNGNTSTSSISNMGSLISSLPFHIAQDGTGSYGSPFNGGIKELRVFTDVVDAATVAAYSNKTLDEQHPVISKLVVYNPGNFNNTTLLGAMGKPNATLTTGVDYDYNDAPYLYNVTPTIFSFLGLPAKAEYRWDGKALVNF